MPRLIELDQIRIAPKRQRRFRAESDHQELFSSISEGEAGLLHAPILWQDEEGIYWLVAGQGRLSVIREMHELGIALRYEGEIVPEGFVPYTLAGAETWLGRYEAEYDENAKRTPLTVAERASATAELFELKKMKAEEAGLPAPTVADLAVEIRGSAIGYYQEATRKELIVARHLDDEDVAKAQTVHEAFKIVKKKETQRKAMELAKEVGPSMRTNEIELIHDDAKVRLAYLPASSYDIVLCDPPYGMGADRFGEYKQAGEHTYNDSFEAWVELWKGVLPELNRVCQPDAHMYLFCDFDRFSDLKAMIESSNGDWRVHRTPIIWHNPTGFRTPWPEHGPQRKYELVLYARRGEKKVLKVCPDVVEYAKEAESVHQAQKPIALLRDLLSRSALPTDRVLDFCAGSGSTGVACREMLLPCTMIERDAIAYGKALQRISLLNEKG